MHYIFLACYIAEDPLQHSDAVQWLQQLCHFYNLGVCCWWAVCSSADSLHCIVCMGFGLLWTMAGLIANRTMQTTTALRTTCKSICKPFANELHHIRTVFRIHDTAGCQSPSLQWHTTCNMYHDMYNAVACELHSQLLCSTLGWHLQVLSH